MSFFSFYKSIFFFKYLIFINLNIFTKNETILVIFKQNDHRPILPVLKTLCTEKRTRNSPLGNYCTNEMEVQKGQEQIVKLFFEGFYCCRPSVLLINSSSNAANLSLYVDCNLESSTLLAIIMKRPLAKFWIFRIITLLHC